MTKLVDLSACERIVEKVAQGCAVTTQAPSAPPAQTAQPPWDGLAVSLGALGTAIAWGAFVIGVIALFAGIGWGAVVLFSSRDAARKAARAHMDETGPAILRAWLEENAAPLLRELEQLRQSDQDGDDRPDFDPEAIAQNVDDDPKG